MLEIIQIQIKDINANLFLISNYTDKKTTPPQKKKYIKYIFFLHNSCSLYLADFPHCGRPESLRPH